MATLSPEYQRAYRARRIASDPDYRNREAREWRAAHPGVFKAIKAKHRAANLEAIRATDRAAQRKKFENPAVRRLHRERQKLIRDARQEALAGRAKPKCCELCGESQPLVFDHCHAGGFFRGWLCDRCNRTLGQVKDSPVLLRKMATYLEASHGTTDSEATEGDAGERVCRPGTIVSDQ